MMISTLVMRWRNRPAELQVTVVPATGQDHAYMLTVDDGKWEADKVNLIAWRIEHTVTDRGLQYEEVYPITALTPASNQRVVIWTGSHVEDGDTAYPSIEDLLKAFNNDET